MNSADLPSRDCCARHLIDWEGPIEKWPDQNYVCDDEIVNRERR